LLSCLCSSHDQLCYIRLAALFKAVAKYKPVQGETQKVWEKVAKMVNKRGVEGKHCHHVFFLFVDNTRISKESKFLQQLAKESRDMHEDFMQGHGADIGGTSSDSSDSSDDDDDDEDEDEDDEDEDDEEIPVL
jgi:hypothetical protein